MPASTDFCGPAAPPLPAMPLRPLTILTTLLHLYIGLRLVGALSAWPGAGPALAVALLVSAIALPMPFQHRSGRRGAAHPVWTWLGLLAMGWFSSLFLLTLLRDLVLAGAWAGGWLQEGGSARADIAAGVVVVATLASLIGFWNARRTAGVRHVDVPLAGLPAALQGFTIVQLSDLHVGPTIRRGYIARIVNRVNALKADAIAITGDLVDGSVAELRDHIAPLADLQARHGSFVVTGNHEYYAGALPWIAELRRLGLRVLLNEHAVLRQAAGQGDGDALVLGGVTDFTAGHFDASHASDPQRALVGAPPEALTRVLLAHQPRSAPAAAQAGFLLQLSGHTHGGQFWPWNLFVPLQNPFVAGLHRLQTMWVYVSRGTGYWGPPMRLGAPSEITLIRLVLA
ncbi:metallophosphoesterase [Acidovorax sp. LjRoot66]|uniref:metallophosphoesterase n=1 Tax=Acidovorax sp. LjRoot66 TaxID=3342334 RepID=UPI003F4F9A59